MWVFFHKDLGFTGFNSLPFPPALPLHIGSNRTRTWNLWNWELQTCELKSGTYAPFSNPSLWNKHDILHFTMKIKNSFINTNWLNSFGYLWLSKDLNWETINFFMENSSFIGSVLRKLGRAKKPLNLSPVIFSAKSKFFFQYLRFPISLFSLFNIGYMSMESIL